MIRRWNSSSLRSQLVAIMTLLMVITVAITGVVTESLLRSSLIDRLDADITTNAQSVSEAYYRGETTNDPSLFRYYGALVELDGTIRGPAQTERPMDQPRIPNLPAESIAELGGRGFNVPGTDSSSDGWRVRVLPLESSPAHFAVATPLAAVNDSVREASKTIFTVGMLATLVASVIAFLAVTRQFKPLARVERTAAAIAAGDLSRRVKIERPATEVGRLSRSLNAMLAHIETAFAARTDSERKMRRFVADASHELRTPLVTIRGFSELYRHGALQKDDDIAAAMGRIESEAIRMGQLVEDLLTLARIDEQRPLESGPVDLMVLGNDAALDARAIAPDRTITVIGLDGGKPRPAPTVGDEARLRQVVANLMTNALRYTPDGTPLEVAVGVEPVIHGRQDSVIEVRDHGPGISEDDAARVFERFYRADSSRHRETGGTGLGLAIVAALVAQHDGAVRLSETPGGGATLSIRLPYATAEPSDPDPSPSAAD